MALRDPKLYRRWVFLCTVGELVGFGGIPVLGGMVVTSLTADMEAGSRALLVYIVAVAGGACEGVVLAWFQLRVLRELLPRLSSRRWTLATAGAASIAWALGMLAPTLDDTIGISTSQQLSIWIPAALLILVSIGLAQATVLRGVVEDPKPWVVANALGWLAGLPWTFVLPALLPETAHMSIWIATFTVAGVLMGLTVGLVTGTVLLRFRPRAT